MGNASSDAAEDAAMARVETLRDHLSDMERAVRVLSRRPQIDVLLPHQRRVCGHVVATDANVRVLLGPVVGRVDATTARVLLEVDRPAMVTCFVLVYDARTDAWAEVAQCSVVDQPVNARRPRVFRIEALLPGRQYRVVFSGLHPEDTETKIASFRTPTLANGGSLRCAVVSGDDVYELEYGEPSLWRDLRRAVVEEQRVQLVLHLGGQVAMKRMFDTAWALLVRHAECVAPPVAISRSGSSAASESNEAAFAKAWEKLEDEAMEILRSAYRTQWTMMSEKASVLANASNLMIWSDWDVYPAYTTSAVFYIDHEKPTLEMQVLRTVVRCARRLYQEYQRALWDDELEQVFVRETELHRIAEHALATAARIHQLGLQISIAQADLELQKKRREIEGARKAERHLRALEAEKSKSEKMLVSYNQLLAPQAGEEFYSRMGDVGFLFLDMRSARIEPGGSQRAENELISNVQWATIEQVFEDETIQLLVLCSETPVVDDLPHELRASSGLDRDCDFKTWWGSNSTAQQRLLGLAFEWKLQQEAREIVLLSGSSNTRFAMSTTVRDTRLRTEFKQYMVGPVTARTCGQVVPSRSGTLFDRYAFEHSEVETVEKSVLYVDVDGPQGMSTSDNSSKKNQRVTITRVDATVVQSPACVLVGPIVGHVDTISALVLLEVDRTCDLVCVVANSLTGERHRVFQHFEGNRPNSFFLNHLRPEQFYEISFERITNSHQYRCSFTTIARAPPHFQVAMIGSMEYQIPLEIPLSSRSVWPWINENLCTGLPFSGADKMIHFEANKTPILEVNPIRHLVAEGLDAKNTRDRIKGKIREVQRLKWNMPGLRQLLACGSHLILTGDSDDINDVDEQKAIVQECINDVCQEYENLLLPPSKRVAHPRDRLDNPIRYVFGSFGIFVLPKALTRTTSGCESFWNCLEEYLKTPLLSFVAFCCSSPIVEDSVEDVEEKARFNSSYRHTLAFQQEKLQRLLVILFSWQQHSTQRSDRRIVFVSGHDRRSFESILHDLSAQTEVPRPPGLRQFVVGPFRQMYPDSSNSLQLNVFTQGTLFERYGYYHRSQSCVQDQQLPAHEQDETEQMPAPSIQSFKHYNSLLILQVSLKPTIDARNVLELTPTVVASDRITLVPPPSATAFSTDDDIRVHLAQSSESQERLTLETRYPVWLNTVVSQPLSEQEEAMIGELRSALGARAADVEVSFQRADSLAKGLVSADDRTSFVAHLRVAFEDFHKHICGVAFRSRYPVVPSAYVVDFTLQELSADGSPTISGAIDVAQYASILSKCFQNAALFEGRLNSSWA